MKKRFFCFFSCFLVLLTLILICNACKKLDKQALNASICKNDVYHVVIDAGHGGEDGGAVGKDGTLEKDINLSISKKLQKFLLMSGFDVKMTRDEDISIHDESADSIREKKVSDLKNRLNMVESDENNLLISIHQNKFAESGYKGTQIFYSKNNPGSENLAEHIKNSVVNLLQPDNTRETKPSNKDIYILDRCKNVGVIVECGFLSNDEELQNLKSDKYQSEMAFSIYCGFLDYLKSM